MRYANLIPHSHIARTADPRLTADARRIFTRAKAAVNVCTESAKHFSRRAALGALALPLVPRTAAASTALRGDNTARLTDHAALWSRMPLPFTPAEAWHLLSPETQAEIGAAVIGLHLAQYVHGDGMAEADQFLCDDLRDAACDVEHDILNRMDDRLWALFPDLYGPDGDHPTWALAGGLAR